MYSKELETERLILRRYKYEDIELYHELTMILINMNHG